MSKQTSIEWLKECLSIHLTHEQKRQFEGLFQQALAMEKEQIVNAFNSGMVNSVDWFNDGITEEAEEYYNETYKGGQDES
jgi:hypothetical protein